MRTLRKFKRQLVVIIIIVVLISLIIYDTHPPKVKARFPAGPPKRPTPFITTFPRLHTSTAGVSEGLKGTDGQKTILLWTEFFGSKTWGAGDQTFQNCAMKKCRVTVDKQEINDADAVLINVRNIYTPNDLPPSHPPHQVWIVHGSEPPYYIDIKEEEFNNVFNWTSWYRSDADIFSPYGHFTHLLPSSDKSGDQHHTPHEPATPFAIQTSFWDDQAIRQNIPIRAQHDNLAEDPFSLHDLMVFWAASNCINYSQRYKLATALQKHLPIDTYGACGKYTCSQGTKACSDLLSRYKFVLSFENGYCRDYVTEKYWRAIGRNQIPIVSGGADYSQVAIPGSYIDVDNFTSVEELAMFVLRVGSDRDLYNSFFLWKKHYIRLPDQLANWCQMCAALHNQSRVPQVYSDFRGWVGDDSCPLQSPIQYLWWSKVYAVFKLFGI